MTTRAASATAVAATPAAAVPSGDVDGAALVALARLLGRAAARAWLLEGADNDNADADRDDHNEPGIPDAG